MEAKVYVAKNGEKRMACTPIEEGYIVPPTANSDMIS